MPKLKDRVGVVYGRLTAVENAPRTYQTMWRCKCECGVFVVVSGINLDTGHTKSCGCLDREGASQRLRERDKRGEENPRAKATKKKMGDAYVSSSDIWYRRAAGTYQRAKARGIPIAFNSAMEFAAFIKGIAPPVCPVFGTVFDCATGVGFSDSSPSIDRIDPTLGYAPGNIQVISVLANCMKRNANIAQLKQFAEWINKNV